MRRVNVVERVTLDGVMQAPGAPDEDRSDGFEHGGWAAPYDDAALGREMAKGMGTNELLFGRRTYQILRAAWAEPEEPNRFTETLTETPKYVASTTLEEPLPWANSTLLHGDAVAEVSRLKETEGKDLVIMGSGRLAQSLMDADLIDAFTLLIHPLVLGEGHRLFTDGGALARMTLDELTTTTKGVAIATYRPAERPAAAY
jgi:dihydrofolate reductase